MFTEVKEMFAGTINYVLTFCKATGYRSILALQFMNLIILLITPFTTLFQAIATVTSSDRETFTINAKALVLGIKLGMFAILGVPFILISKRIYTINTVVFFNDLFKVISGEDLTIDGKVINDQNVAAYLKA